MSVHIYVRLALALLTLAPLVLCERRVPDTEVTEINDDGSARYPEQLREHMRKQPQLLEQIKKHDPEFHRIVTGEVSVFENEEELFQDHMRKVNRPRSLNPDGSAVDVEAYKQGILQQHAAEGVDIDAYLQKLARRDQEMHAALIADGEEGLEQLQDLLRERKKARDHAEWVKSQPPPPPTPYDEVGDVGMSFRVQTDSGEEKDMYMVSPKSGAGERTHPKPHLAVHMQCAACAAFTYQAARAIAAAFRKNDLIADKKWREPGSLVAEHTLDELCRDKDLWAKEYGVEAGARGLDLLTGPGIPRHPDSLEGDTAVMGQKMHSEHLGRQARAAGRRRSLLVPPSHAAPPPPACSCGRRASS